MRTYLIPEYDSAKSFYNKAVVETDGKGGMKLFSYETLVAEYIDMRPVVYSVETSTTLRHVKEFLKQGGFKAETKAQIERDYVSP